ncbi:hypothetical protein EVAR_48051_1 [Eumeta japonica]|uniref:Uncharacterized protein n=1 Tax=Eumeta variegata TaxID=151549 RepID=A0A4C1XFR4_EUMVA|nr:hypothetical protein EVAR_48051_1 [Eumeta japonica]
MRTLLSRDGYTIVVNYHPPLVAESLALITSQRTKLCRWEVTHEIVIMALLASVDDALAGDDSDTEGNSPPAVWETSFTVRAPPPPPQPPAPPAESGPVVSINPLADRELAYTWVDKLISITPTSPKPPENPLSKAIESNVIDKTNQLAPERKMAPIASPDPPRINAWPKEAPALAPKPKPLCLNAAQLEQNLNALKKNSGSVNLTTMNIVPPYINVVTTGKTKNSDAKTIQIDPKRAVIHDLQSPKEGEHKPENKLKQSDSAASLLNGPMTDVPYADSDNASSSSGSNAPNHIQNIQKSMQNNYSAVKMTNNDVRVKVTKQGSNGGAVNDSEISC